MRSIIFIVAGLAIGFWLGGYHIIKKPTADQLYGCTIKQQTPNGDCP